MARNAPSGMEKTDTCRCCGREFPRTKGANAGYVVDRCLECRLHCPLVGYNLQPPECRSPKRLA